MKPPAHTQADDDAFFSGVVVCDLLGTIRWIDASLSNWLRVEPQSLTGIAFDDFFRPVPDPKSQRSWPPGTNDAWDARVIGYPHRVLVRVTALPDDCSGRLVCSIIAYDGYVMERVVAGHTRLRSTIGAVVQGFAHEVRNPLASILTLTELAIRELKASYVPVDGLLRIPTLVSRIERLMRQTLEYGKPPRPVPEVFAADYLIRSSIRLVQSRFPHVIFEVMAAPELSVCADRQQSEQILSNLLQNACEAGASRVVVEGVQDLERRLTLLRVSDNGTGLHDDLVPNIFEPFFTSKAHGTGLGLAIAGDLSRLNGGEILLTHNSPEGATFQLALRNCPLVQE